MTGTKDCRRSGCPISFTLDLVGDKWTLLIIRDMIFEEKKGFGDFSSSAEHIATNILTDRLKKLEDAGLITKQLDPEHQKKFIYRLTTKGIDLIPIVLEMIKWGAKYDPKTDAPAEFVKSLNEIPNPIAEQLKKNFLKND